MLNRALRRRRAGTRDAPRCRPEAGSGTAPNRQDAGQMMGFERL
jgi:hypothetical protein